ncbi:hypothetical protein EOD41_08105 [Mucilaginibacter limnophilus]|uniref:DUF748 domain-containing protein n=1 Tax=Mucilaginibacter limnophilus TaxID=1932778 RepID=A0A3S2V9D8_9SPHI|nr:hypothetical protein [Mucilaginibacter limnophilus]RVU01908.1 hypothetical protein EOD41_08105 [Mucilaginibacter limnophilus]
MTDTSTPKRRIKKWPFLVLAVLLAIGATGYYLYNKYLAGNKWKPLLQAKLKELVLNSTDSLYRIEYSDFNIDLNSGNASLEDFKLIPDTNVYNKLVALKKAPDNLFTLSVKKLQLKNFKAKKAYDEKVLNMDGIFIDKPDLMIVNKRLAFNDTVKVGKSKTPYQVISKVFKQLHIDSVGLKDVSLTYINKNGPVAKRSALKNLDINVSDIFIDSLSAQDTSRFYYTRGVNVTVRDYKINTPDNLYEAKVDKIFFSTSGRNISLDKVSFLPRYNKRQFYIKRGTPGDIFSLKFKKISIDDIDLQRFLRDQKLYAGILNLVNADVEIYNNNAYKGKKRSKIGKDPHQALQKVALEMRLKRLNLKNANIEYKEADAKTGFTGVIQFKKTNGYILNMTNDAPAKKLNKYMTAHINTRFMNAGNLTVNFKFDLTSPTGAFNYNGTLGRFNGRVLDKLVKPLVLVHVESADVQKLHFNVNASNYYGKGQLQFYYNNLKVDLLKKEEGKRQLQKQGFISKIANTLIIEDDNPDKDGKFRPGPINVARDPKTGFFSFLYKALLDGLKPSVGFDAKTEKRVNNTVSTISNLVDKFNTFKENRKKRREEKKKEKALKEAQEAKEKATEEAKEKAEKEAKEKAKAEKKAQEEKEEAAKKAAEEQLKQEGN